MNLKHLNSFRLFISSTCLYYRSLQGSIPQTGDITAQSNIKLPQLKRAMQVAYVNHFKTKLRHREQSVFQI